MGQVDKVTSRLKFDSNRDRQEVKVKIICENVIYVIKSEDYLSGLYYLISCKSYLKEDHMWELILVIQYLRKLLNTFHKKDPDKPTTSLNPVDLALPTSKLIVKPFSECLTTKYKQGRLAKNSNTCKYFQKNYTQVSFSSRLYKILFWFSLPKFKRFFYQCI